MQRLVVEENSTRPSAETSTGVDVVGFLSNEAITSLSDVPKAIRGYIQELNARLSDTFSLPSQRAFLEGIFGQDRAAEIIKITDVRELHDIRDQLIDKFVAAS